MRRRKKITCHSCHSASSITPAGWRCYHLMQPVGRPGQRLAIAATSAPTLTKVCAKPKAMHVVATNWENDGPGPKDFEKAGFRITLDAPAPDPASVNSNSVIVSAEMPFTLNGQIDTTLSQIVNIAGTASIDPLDAKTIVWKIGGQNSTGFRPYSLTTGGSRAVTTIQHVMGPLSEGCADLECQFHRCQSHAFQWPGLGRAGR